MCVLNVEADHVVVTNSPIPGIECIDTACRHVITAFLNVVVTIRRAVGMRASKSRSMHWTALDPEWASCRGGCLAGEEGVLFTR